jgi:hypothetical protein
MIGEIPLNDPWNYTGTGSFCHEWERHIGDSICAKNIIFCLRSYNHEYSGQLVGVRHRRNKQAPGLPLTLLQYVSTCTSNITDADVVQCTNYSRPFWTGQGARGRRLARSCMKESLRLKRLPSAIGGELNGGCVLHTCAGLITRQPSSFRGKIIVGPWLPAIIKVFQVSHVPHRPKWAAASTLPATHTTYVHVLPPPDSLPQAEAMSGLGTARRAACIPLPEQGRYVVSCASSTSDHWYPG